METTELIAPLGSAITWFLLTILTKSIGQRVKPDKVPSKIWDTILDILTLIFAWQVALSLSETKLIKTIVKEMKGGSEAMADASGWAIITGTVLGIAFLLAGLYKGYKFAKEDELATAWRPLVLFALFVLVAGNFLPWIDDITSWIGVHATVPIGNALVALINYVFSAPH